MLGRYIFYRVLSLFLLVLCSALIVFAVLDVVGNIEIWMTKTRLDMLRYYGYYLPQMAFLAMPVAVLLTVLLSMGALAKHMEVAALRAVGFSPLRIAFPVLAFMALICAVLFWVSDRYLPDFNHARLEIAQPKTRNAEKNKREKDKWNFVYMGAAGHLYTMRHYSADDSTGKDVVVLSGVDQERPSERWQAEKMVWKKNTWVLYKVQKGVLKEGEWQWSEADSLVLKPQQWPEKPQDLLDTRFKTDEMTMAHMRRKMDALRRAGEETRGLETQWHFRISSATTSFWIALFALGLVLRKLKQGLFQTIGLGLLYTILYYLALRFGLILGENGAVPPIAAAWIAHFFFGGLGLLLFYKVARS
jgi:LPS export ABC transporter permease LptG